MIEKSQVSGRTIIPADVWRALKKCYGDARSRARADGYEFSLTTSELRALYEKADGVCSITGLPFELHRTGHFTRAGTLSLDRIDSSRPYELSNLRLVRWHTNAAIGQFGDAEFDRLVDARVAFRKRQRTRSIKPA